ncbi:hypothetical protein E4K73_39735 [Streptomyces sp. IB201691-2A2]|nr:hypothetical protein E4K73_39735 [Streptomyces sp. IB201691-2A2]
MVSKRLGTTVCVLSKPQLSLTRERPTPLYWVIGEASLPDVDSGCFIHSPATAAEHFRKYGSGVEGFRSKLKRLVERGRLAEEEPGPFMPREGLAAAGDAPEQAGSSAVRSHDGVGFRRTHEDVPPCARERAPLVMPEHSWSVARCPGSKVAVEIGPSADARPDHRGDHEGCSLEPRRSHAGGAGELGRDSGRVAASGYAG